MKRILSLVAVLLTYCLCLAERSWAQSGQLYHYTVNTAVGNYQYGNGGPATQALLAFPDKIAIDSKGAIYVADRSNQMVRKIVAGQVSTVAGNGTAGFSGDGKAATAAELDLPADVAVDESGNVYIYDTSNSVIRKVDSNGIITTFAGTPDQPGSGGDQGSATQAKLNLAGFGGLAVDAAGNVYISDTFNEVVRKVTASTGVISVFAGVTGTIGSSGDGGPATAANLHYPGGLAFDSAGNLYIADVYNSEIRMVSAKDGSISTVAGSGQPGSGGDGGPAKAAQLSLPEDVAVDAAGNLYIADTNNNKIRKVTSGTITTLAGNGTLGNSGDGGPGTAAELSSPEGVAVNSSGAVYIVDSDNSRIRVLNGQTIAQFAGADHAQGDGGKASSALLYFPEGLALDAQGNLFIADTKNNRIRKVTPDGTITTVAGNGGFFGSGDGGPALSAGLNQPSAVAVDSSGNLYITTGNQVRKVDTQGIITTVVNTAGMGGFSGDGGPATTAQLDFPFGIAVDSGDNLYIADTYNHRIRKVVAGNISTVAGSGPTYPTSFGSFAGDGGLATAASLSFPYGVALDNSNNLLIADTSNEVIRRVDSKTGIIQTIAGMGRKPGYGGDGGPATSALLYNPFSVAADTSGNIYIADASNKVVREVDGLGIISTIAGNTTSGFSGDGGPSGAAELDFPYGIVADASGKVWFTDTNNNRVRQLTPSGPLVSNGPQGVTNGASFVRGGLVPGGIATLFGTNLTTATGINLNSGLPLGTQLLNSSVKFNNSISAPIFAVDNVNGQQQINFQVPWELAPLVGSSVVVQVITNGVLSPTVLVPVLAAQPGVINYTVGSDKFGVVLHANFQLADTAHPATAGEVVLIFCSSLGAVSPTVKDGQPATGKEMTVATTTVTIGHAPAPVSFSGLAPGFVGLYQVNAQVPSGLTAMNQDLVVSISGASSPAVLLPVK